MISKEELEEAVEPYQSPSMAQRWLTFIALMACFVGIGLGIKLFQAEQENKTLYELIELLDADAQKSRKEAHRYKMKLQDIYGGAIPMPEANEDPLKEQEPEEFEL